MNALYVIYRAKDQTENPMSGAEFTVDTKEIAKFEAMAAEWWDPNGKFKPLHMLNPCRLDYIIAQIAAEFDRDLERDTKGLSRSRSRSNSAAICAMI